MYLCAEKNADCVIIPTCELNALINDQTLLEMDLVTLVDNIDQLLEGVEAMLHLNQTVLGIVSSAEAGLDPHRRRTVKGMTRKLKRLEQQTAAICDSAEDALEEMSERWDFLTMATDAGDEPFDF